jgi:VWFA-related protein
MIFRAAICALAVALGVQTPQFRAGVDLVQLDVSVLDKKTRVPVRGLTAADFTVLEDGSPQTVAAFSFVDIPDTPPVPVVAAHRVTWMRDVAPDVQTNASAGKPDSRLIVLLIDDAMIPFEPWVMQQTKKAARSVIEKLSPSDRVAVVLSAESVHAQDFTSDRARMLAAVERVHPGYATFYFGWNHGVAHPAPAGAFQPSIMIDDDISIREMSMGTLDAVAAALIAAPDRRKMLVYISPGIPVNPGWAATPQLASGSSLQAYEANKKLFEELPELFRRMRRENITIYAIDPTGIAGMAPIVTRAIDSLGISGLMRLNPLTGQPDGHGPLVQPAPELGHFEAGQYLNFLLMAADNTGGRAMVNNDDFEPGIREMFVENSSYYLLGYSPPAQNPPGTMHRITVRVNRQNVEVRTRSGYFTPKPEKVDPNRPEPSPAAKAIGGVLPAGDIPLRVVVAPMGWFAPPAPVVDSPKGKLKTQAVAAGPILKSSVAIVLGLQRQADAKSLLDTVDVQISAFSPDGFSRGASSQVATVTFRPVTTSEPVRYEALSHIELKPGRYQLRIAAYSSLSDATGSVYADVDVPDFAKEPLSMSGVLLDVSPPPPSAPRGTLAAIAPIVPTSERAFQKLDRASAFVRVYQGGSDPLESVTVTTRVVDEHDIAIADRVETLTADRFSATTRFADYRFELPIATMTRGEYLLTFEAAVGKVTKRRDVRFTVK